MNRGGAALLVAALALGSTALAAQVSQGFDHARHRRLFPSCTACHAGAAEPGAPMWPDSGSCGACHDGTIQKRVVWWPPHQLPHTNLRFDHATHASALSARPPARGGPLKPLDCAACHVETGGAAVGAPPPAVAAVGRCLDCHGVHAPHLAAPDTACATCHLPLAQATRLSTRDIAGFAAPPSHEAPGFGGAAGHGLAAQGANCAICHAREFCVQCHVDAPERAAIQALASDRRATAIHATLHAPASHADAAFLTGHGASATANPAKCATCHTRETCETCHRARVRIAAVLPSAGPGRGPGAVVARRRPPSHGANYTERHAAQARAAPPSCAACHARSDCLECHRPDAARAPRYHPADFLARHPAAAYGRETNCSDCHNTAGFCMSCHARSGVVASGRLRPGYHDSNNAFQLGHGQAARLNLESCVGCHVERDCLTCHSALGGRHFNPHGPGFDANRLRQKNPQMCTVCHGAAIPSH